MLFLAINNDQALKVAQLLFWT